MGFAPSRPVDTWYSETHVGSTVRCEISGRSLWSSRGGEKCNGHDVHVNTIIVAIAIVWVALVTLIAEIEM